MNTKLAVKLLQELRSEPVESISDWSRYCDTANYIDWTDFVELLNLQYELIYVAGELYLVRYFLTGRPSSEGDHDGRVLLHHFIRGDYDRRPHNHPWHWAESVILSGGYIEDRVLGFTDGQILMGYPEYRAGDINRLTGMDFHRVHSVLDNTWTLFRHGPHEKEWGFIDGPPAMTDYADYNGPINE